MSLSTPLEAVVMMFLKKGGALQMHTCHVADCHKNYLGIQKVVLMALECGDLFFLFRESFALIGVCWKTRGDQEVAK